MSKPSHSFKEQAVAEAFSAQAPVFDQLYAADPAIVYKRKRVRDHFVQQLKRGAQILELNAGTGEDAIWLVRHGYRVHATDISTGMLDRLAEKVDGVVPKLPLTYEECSFAELETLSQRGPYDAVFSNFAGMNCTNQLDAVLSSCSKMVKSGGVMTLVLLPKFCLWETLMVFRGRFKTAFRRMGGSHPARVEGKWFRCWYYNPSYIVSALKTQFELCDLEGLCTLVPPSYIQNFEGKYPRVYRTLQRWEQKMSRRWPWRSIGDYYIISLRKKSNGDGL